MGRNGNFFLGAVFLSLFLYVAGLLVFTYVTKYQKKPLAVPKTFDSSLTLTSDVLGFTKDASVILFQPSPSYSIDIAPRRQVYGLSCEFAVATAILYHFTSDSRFSLKNAKTAEELLIGKVGVSQNPNLGIRMGEVLPSNAAELYGNLNKKFGGSDYYGVHAPPFIDIFNSFGLRAKPIRKDEDSIVIARIKQAIFDNHLVMSWLKIGFGGTVDVAFTYGNVPVVKGEHAVVIRGYDEENFLIMDPGSGSYRSLSYADLIKSASYFPMPFLEVYSSSNPLSTLEETVGLGSATGLVRGNLSILIENATGKPGRGSQMAEILKEFGYRIVDVATRDPDLYSVQSGVNTEGITISIQPAYKDYLYVLKKDLTIAEYDVESVSADLSASSSARVVITVGE